MLSKSSNQAKRLEQVNAAQVNKIAKLQIQLNYLDGCISKYESFKDKIEETFQAKVKEIKNQQLTVDKLISDLTEKPDQLANTGLIHPPHIKRIFGSKVDFNMGDLSPSKMSLDQLLGKVKDHIVGMENKIQSQVFEIVELKQSLTLLMEPKRRKSISKRDRLASSQSPTRKSIISINTVSKLVEINPNMALRENADSNGSPSQTSKGKMFSFGGSPQNLETISENPTSYLRSETLKNKLNVEPLKNLGVISEAKSRSFSNRNIDPYSSNSNDFSLSDDSPVLPGAVSLLADRERTLKTTKLTLDDSINNLQQFRDQLTGFENDMQKIFGYVRNFEVFLSEDDR